MQTIFYLFEIIIGATFLGFSAHKFIDASVSLAKHYKIPTLVIGILLVGFGTSFPELIVAILASIHKNADIAIGTVVGSNIANLGLVLGLTTIIVPITIASRIIKREIPVLIIVSLILGCIFLSGNLSRYSGVFLILLLLLHFYLMFLGKPTKNDSIVSQYKEEIKATMKKKSAFFWWFIGLIILVASSELFLRGATSLARSFHISELVIGLTIVTFGTSLPELAATIVSALKSEFDVAFGHIIGSNIFNSLAVLAMPALFSPSKLPPHLIERDYPVMLGFTMVVWLFLLLSHKKIISRFFGIFLLLAYIGYLCVLALA